MKNVAIDVCRRAGVLLLDRFGKVSGVSYKGDISNVVTEADLASENLIVSSLRKAFPAHGIVAEESGVILGSSEYTWVVDPLDGTSNFSAGIPWFGVLLALFRGTEPVLGVMSHPAANEIYFAEVNGGAFRNGQPIAVTAERELRNVLFAYGMDATTDAAQAKREMRLLSQLKNAVRNVRATNSVVDVCFAADGRLGGLVNQQMKIWDIAAAQVVIQEAGGRVTDLGGHPLVFDLREPSKNYRVIAGAPALHSQVVEMSSLPL